ncbi:MAG: P-loop NTPase [Alphaproteobacteria bacterium]|nr:P-loop NTPase [Alphaproteobacteria bacterium]
MKKSYMGFAADDETRAALEQFARDLYLPEEDVIDGDTDSAVEVLSNVPTPECIFVDMGQSLSPLTELDKLAGVCDPGTQVIAMGTVNDISVFRDMLDAGVADYLLKPVTPDRLKQAYEKAIAPPHQTGESSAKALADVIVVVGTRGGVGTSMISTNMAWILAHENKKKVGLVDLDPYFGNTAALLNLEPGRGLSEALDAPERIDNVFVDRTMIKEHDNLLILGAEEAMQNEVPMDAASIETLIEKLRENFQVLIVEPPHGNMPAIKAAIRMATHIVFVSTYSVVGMRDIIRLSGLANQLAAGTRQLVLANQGTAGKSDVNAKDFESVTGLAVDAEIPSDERGVAAALNAGSALPVGAPKSPVLKALRKVCNSLYGGGAKAKGKSKGRGKGKNKSENKGGGFFSSLLGSKAS